MNQIKNARVAIVTGAARGIGAAVARRLASDGFAVAVNYASSSKEADAVVAELEANGAKAIAVQADVRNPDDVRRMFDTTEEKLGKVDVLVNNAGIFNAKPFVEYTSQELNALVDTNLKGFFYPSQAVARHMIGRKSGHIVNITASLASQPIQSVPAVLPVLIKGGINQATKAMALELAPHNIQVSAVAPGIVDTPMYSKDMHGFLNGLSPAGRIANVQEIVDAVLYLSDAAFTTGVVLPVDGGMSSGKW